MAHTPKQAAQEPEPTNAEVASATAVRLKRCKDHPVNFPEEDVMRPLSEFYGKAKHVYCKRCENIRGKARRDLLKAQADPYGGELALYKMPAIIREVQAQIEVEIPSAEAIELTMQGLQNALSAVRTALEQHFAAASTESEQAEDGAEGDDGPDDEQGDDDDMTDA